MWEQSEVERIHVIASVLSAMSFRTVSHPLWVKMFSMLTGDRYRVPKRDS